MRLIVIASTFSALLSLATGCDRDKGTPRGLAPAQEWTADGTGAMAPVGKAMPTEAPTPPPGMAQMGAAGGSNPHAADPHAGLGIDPAGGGGGVDVSQMGAPPDPNRPVDPTRYIRGVIKLHEKAKGRATAGTPMYVTVKRADASGQPVGTPLAVDKLAFSDGAIAFELTEKNAMVAGTELSGDVVVTVRYDQDGDALSKEPGDITGSVRVTLPAQDVQIWLDTIL